MLRLGKVRLGVLEKVRELSPANLTLLWTINPHLGQGLIIWVVLSAAQAYGKENMALDRMVRLALVRFGLVNYKIFLHNLTQKKLNEEIEIQADRKLP